MNDKEYIKKLESMVDDLTARLKSLDEWSNHVYKSHSENEYFLSAFKIDFIGAKNGKPFSHYVLTREMVKEANEEFKSEFVGEENIIIYLPK